MTVEMGIKPFYQTAFHGHTNEYKYVYSLVNRVPFGHSLMFNHVCKWII